MSEPQTEEEIRADERAQCARECEQFAHEYVAKWERAGQAGNSIAAQGWAILQAAKFIALPAVCHGPKLQADGRPWDDRPGAINLVDL